ncbi:MULTISPECIES: hypothetical protein [unclassified Acinetobacter]|uniref:hypothetical protein n=1 Tax=unclassified Acinetobacter TaxID=196816 RepID=UPI001909E91E|nr:MULTISPECIES: hypothetical protein [unclassified Acinetobacter]MBK0062131.1 hypothetical protein [Acinetobacter sp. S55]MBK0065935.1 hypothetical protein [Acinetobacter sp. S54]
MSLKNILAFLISIVSLCSLIIFLHFMHIDKYLNLISTSLIFGLFIHFYYKKSKIILILNSTLFIPIFIINPCFEIVAMFISSTLTGIFSHTISYKLGINREVKDKRTSKVFSLGQPNILDDRELKGI